MTNDVEPTLAELVTRVVGGYLGNTRRGSGFCVTCCRPIDPRFSQCYECRFPSIGPGTGRSPALADQVAPLAYGGVTYQSRRLLFGYKEPMAAAPGDERRTVVQLLLWAAFHFHRQCLENGLPFRFFAVVPSTRSRPAHPLGDLVKGWLTSAGLEERELSATGRVSGRVIDPAKFSSNEVNGGHVLLVDDTWTTGANVQSAAWTLKNVGADAVTALVVARWLGDHAPTSAFLASHPNVGYNPLVCPAPHGHVTRGAH